MKAKHTVRIIAGQWRGRRLPVANMPGLRPSKDYVRETAFNWLQAIIPGSRCLDLFAGSGAFAFEAASRGAAEVVMVEAAASVAQILQQQIQQLAADNMCLQQMTAANYLQQVSGQFDIVFLDPPFAENMLAETCQQLQTSGCLRSNARLYFEVARQQRDWALPQGWQIHRQKVSGDVCYGLVHI